MILALVTSRLIIISATLATNVLCYVTVSHKDGSQSSAMTAQQYYSQDVQARAQDGYDGYIQLTYTNRAVRIIKEAVETTIIDPRQLDITNGTNYPAVRTTGEVWNVEIYSP